ncbi:biopolymer transporter ExbD [Tatumella sp. JGM118]|uniref:biopolymer transporter ExbD n=1 Tax=Tatumella sp. JGM118 TaxID=2799796 RepID=UPI001BAEA8F3|nr:biopolymer transporter ExbD [Tatumella sp. JGM118]MBS0910622.1 biopolymer transporter ExbD [Tatumella sp. JGM118]
MGFSILKQVSDEPYEISDINVTPFIDVMLVLLIIFMVAAPLSTSNIKIDLPIGTDKTQKLLATPLVVTIKKDGTLYVNNKPVNQAGLSTAIKRAIKPGDDDRIFLQADKGLQYQQLITIMDTLRHEGYTKIALVDLTGN